MGWTVSLHAAAIVIVAAWQWLVATQTCARAADPWTVDQLDGSGRRARRTVVGVVVAQGLILFGVLATVGAVTCWGLVVAARSLTPPGGWSDSTSRWAPVVGALTALVVAMVTLVRAQAGRDGEAPTPWVERLLSARPATQCLQAIQESAQRVRQGRSDDVAERTARALPRVLPLPPAVLQRRLETVGHQARPPRGRARGQAPSFPAAVRRVLAQYAQEVDDGESEAQAREFCYSALLRLLVDHAGPQALHRLLLDLPGVDLPGVDLPGAAAVHRPRVIDLTGSERREQPGRGA